MQYLLTDATHAEEFAVLARACGADFVEVYLDADRETALRRLMERGVWGEPGSPTLTEKDLPEMEACYDAMIAALKFRPYSVSIPVLVGDVENTYKNFLKAVGE